MSLCFFQERNPTSVLGKAAPGSLLVRMNWRGITANTREWSHSSVRTVTAAFPGQTIWHCTAGGICSCEECCLSSWAWELDLLAAPSSAGLNPLHSVNTKGHHRPTMSETRAGKRRNPSPLGLKVKPHRDYTRNVFTLAWEIGDTNAEETGIVFRAVYSAT